LNLVHFSPPSLPPWPLLQACATVSANCAAVGAMKGVSEVGLPR
jgi:hypothetical protein